MARGEPLRHAGKYELLRRLPAPGPLEVYLARMNEAAVILRRLPPELAQNRPAAARFAEEARTLALLTHPNVTRLVDSGEDGQSCFIATELPFGEDLASVIAAERKQARAMPMAIALGIMAQLLEALGYVHRVEDGSGARLGLVHCGVSAENAILGFDGRLTLVGFDLARRARLPASEAGVVRGHIGYAAPEQLVPGEIDPRADLFAAGVLLYELLAGKRPFDRGSEFHTLKAIRGEPHAPLRSLRPDLPPAIEALFDQALAKSPADRFDDAAQMREALGFASPEPPAGAKALSEYAVDLFAAKLGVHQAAAASGRASLSQILAVVQGAPVKPPRRASQPVARAAPRPRASSGPELTAASPVPPPREAASAPSFPRPAPARRSTPEPRGERHRFRMPSDRALHPAVYLASTLAALILALLYVHQGGSAPAPPAAANKAWSEIPDRPRVLPVAPAPIEPAAPAPSLEPPPAPPPEGSIRIESDERARVFLDGRAMGDAPVEAQVEAGTHLVKVVSGEGTRVFKLAVRAKRRVRKRVTFRYAPPQPEAHSWP